MILHITSGDSVGAALCRAFPGEEVFVWHDVLYEGPRKPGWLSEEGLLARAAFLHDLTGGGLGRDEILSTLKAQYQRIRALDGEAVLLWFDACLFDQSMLAHLLTLLDGANAASVEILCIDAHPGVEPFDGLGQLSPEALASRLPEKKGAGESMIRCAARADRAFALQDWDALSALAQEKDAPLPWVPAAAARWLEERPDPQTGLGRLERLILNALQEGATAPAEIFRAVSSADRHPQFWGDTTLWARINGLADRGLLSIDGPVSRLPQWEGGEPLKAFRVVRAH